MNDVASNANTLAQRQVYTSTQKALAGYELSEDEIESVASIISGSIDVTDAMQETKIRLAAIQEALSDIPEIEVPDCSISLDGITPIIEDMQTQLSVLCGTAQTMSELAEVLDSANQFIAEIQEDSKKLKKKSQALLSNLDCVDNTINKAHTYVDMLNASIQQIKNGNSDKLTENMQQLVDGASILSQSMDEFHNEGVLPAIDYAENATIQALVKRMKAIQLAADEYTNISGIGSDTEGNIRFIIRTEALEK